MSQFPSEVVYGVYADDLLTFLPADYAQGAADEVDAWRRVSTWGEAFELAERTRWVEPPFDADEARDEYSDEDPFDVGDFEQWPLPAATVVLDVIGDDWPLGEQQDLFMGDVILRMEPDDEPALLDLFRERHATFTRDDSLIARASGH